MLYDCFKDVREAGGPGPNLVLVFGVTQNDLGLRIKPFLRSTHYLIQ